MQEYEYLPFDPTLPTLRTLQSAMPTSGKLVADFNSAPAAGEETLTSFLRERVFSKNISLHASVPLSKRLTFAKEPGATKPGEELTATEMGRTALKAVINLLEISQCVDLPQLLEYRVVEECMTLFNSDGIYRERQKSKLTQKLSLSAIYRPTGTLRRCCRHGHDLEYGSSNSRRSADGRWHPIQLVGLRAQGVIHHPCPPRHESRRRPSPEAC